MENKNEGNENKIILRDFNCTTDKMDRYGERKHKDFIDAVSIMPSLKIMAWGSMVKGEARFPEFTRSDICFGRYPGKTGSILI